MGLIGDMANLPHGIQHVAKWDPVAETLLVKGVQDVEPILEHNKRLANNGEDGYSPSRDLRRVASIPNVRSPSPSRWPAAAQRRAAS